LRIGKLFELQYLRSAELIYTYGSHDCLLHKNYQIRNGCAA
jgi:hypothetical protein